MDLIIKSIIGIGLFCTLLQLIVVFFEFKIRRKGDQPASELPPVSILKPLKGIDDELESNLQSFFELDYPEYELIFGVSDSTDPAVKIVKSLQWRYSHVPSRLVINSARIGLNPKINTLQNSLRFACHDHLLISDSNVRVGRDYLSDLMTYFLQGGFGLVTSTIRGAGAKTLGALLENLHLNSSIAGTVLAASRIFRRPISVGKSMLLKKATLDQIGGFRAFRNVLAEDYLMGEAVRARGLKVSTAPLVVDNINVEWSLERFLNRHTRWAKMRKHASLYFYAGELLLNPIFNSLLYFLIRQNTAAVFVLAATVFTKMILDGMIIRTLQADLKWQHLFLIPAKDSLLGFAWFIPFLSRKVAWRGNHFRITKKTELLPLTQEG